MLFFPENTFRVAWEAIQQREVQYPKTWLRKIAENIIRNRLRRSVFVLNLVKNG